MTYRASRLQIRLAFFLPLVPTLTVLLAGAQFGKNDNDVFLYCWLKPDFAFNLIDADISETRYAYQ